MDQSFTKYEYLTLYLVNCDARPSCLFLNNEYTKKLESNIKKYFPNLKFTHSPFFGYFVSKQYLNITDHTSSDDVGIILGYPSDDIKYTEIDFNKDTYGTSIMITIDDVTISLLDTKTQNSIIDKMTSIMDIFTQKLLDKECYYCHYYKKEEVNGIDRVDNTKGYTKENSVSCCEMCNRIKLLLKHYNLIKNSALT